MARRLVTLAKTSRDSMTSYSRRQNLQSRRIRNLGSGSTIRVVPLSIHYRITLCLKISPSDVELCETELRPKLHTFQDASTLCFAACSVLHSIGGVKLVAGF